jgi:acetylornithine/succinyldiaminopimelate/putrescine aminotransferase
VLRLVPPLVITEAEIQRSGGAVDGDSDEL